LAEPTAVADAFAKHFESVHNNCCSIDLPRLSHSSECLPLAPVSDADVCKAIKRLKPSKYDDDILGFIIKGCPATFIPILRHVFNLTLTRQYFHAARKEAALALIFKRGNDAATSNYRHISILRNFSKLLQFIIHYHVSYYAKFNPNRHRITRIKSSISNLVTFLDFLIPVVLGQRQADAMYFDLSNAFDFVLHIVLLHKWAASDSLMLILAGLAVS
jgi:hypothetical protein